MKRFAVLALILLVLLGVGCVRQLRHSQSQAAAVAEDFLNVLIVDKDAPAAFEMIDPESAESRSASNLEQAAKQHGGLGVVTSVTATEYQPVPGQPVVDIYLTGSAGAKSYYYLVQMSGTMDTGYRPAHFSLSESPFPASELRKPLN